MDAVFILLLALGVDLLLGDPPTALHPVGWMGWIVALLQRFSLRAGSRRQFCYGVGMVVLGIAGFTVPTFFLLNWLKETSGVAYVVVGALVLKSTFSIKGLRRGAGRVRHRLQEEDLPGARYAAGMLVSRDTGQLNESQLVAATVESVSENTSDSIVAPLFWFLLLGVPGAVGYRMANTFDAMVGYRHYEFLGKFAARLDDILNFLPARLTGLLTVAAAALGRADPDAAWRIMWRHHSRTTSPNAGWPMSAAAGALEVRLEKIGVYALGEDRRPLTSDRIEEAVRLMYLVALLWVGICLLALALGGLPPV